MTIFEFLGEASSPGEWASFESSNQTSRPKNYVILIFGVIAISLLIYFSIYVIQNGQSVKSIILTFLITALYIMLAIRISIRVPANNIGLFGLPIDNPFRISDDFNRFFVLIAILLLPGQFIGRSISNLTWLIHRMWRMRKFISWKL